MDWRKELSKINFFKEPKKSSSKKSDSIYLGWNDQKNKTIILQYLPPNSKTSKHHHRLIEEQYHVLAGECVILQNNKKIRLTKNLKIKKNEIHQLRTEKTGCLILLFVFHKGNSLWRKDKVLD